MSIPRAYTGEPITAEKWNQMAAAIQPQSEARSSPRLWSRMEEGDATPSFWIYQEAREPFHQRVNPGWICVEGGTPFLPSPMVPELGCMMPDGENVYLNLYIKAGTASQDPSTSPTLGGEYPPGSEASAEIATEPGEQKDGYSLTVITLSVWKPRIGSTPAGPEQHWASDIFITKRGAIVPGEGLPVHVRVHPATGWGPDENVGFCGLEVEDESDSTKWQHALALKVAHEYISADSVTGQEYQLGGVYRGSVYSGTVGQRLQIARYFRPQIDNGEIVFPLAYQDKSNPSIQQGYHTFGLLWGAAWTDEPEPYVADGCVYIPRCTCDTSVGSNVDPSGGGSYNPGGGGFIPLPPQPANLTAP
ncbi:hypothetical protein ICN84_01670 [Akkermansia glycaniphila]|uniref:hypothetical protein n=1 Tax=Akkermansia glycaniphila TaxID=1679444 RepID=UPI001C0318EC|nr:hypothetical protein [Akkermansia glycaniphila]MBT9448779.1 hypothetical protein [Akkermansia glycaniphila]